MVCRASSASSVATRSSPRAVAALTQVVCRASSASSVATRSLSEAADERGSEVKSGDGEGGAGGWVGYICVEAC